MKKLLKYGIICLIIILSACRQSPVIGDEKNPFIVEQIVQIDDTMSKYYGCINCGYGGSEGMTKPSIVLPSGVYNIGDTVKIKY